MDNLSINPKIEEDDLAYILFTSGSTGKPKGVQISRKNLGAFIEGFWASGIELDENDRCLQCFDLTFDMSVQSYLAPLIKGACCFTVPHNQIKYIYVGGLIEEHNLTVAVMVPSMLRYLRPYFDELNFSSIRYGIFCGEGFPLALANDLYRIAPRIEIYNFYGPTEATIYCTYYKMQRGVNNKSLNGIISIGIPMKNVILRILDEKGNEVREGDKGELCISGDYVTKGYLNNPIRNAEAFLIKEIDGKDFRFYRTGDLCCFDEESDLMHAGRMDFQVKVQGFRIELGEIESHARDYLEGIDTVCVAFDNRDGVTQIAMFIESKERDIEGLLEYMKSKMPQYMIPSNIYFEPKFPLNANGKTYRSYLKSKIKI